MADKTAGCLDCRQTLNCMLDDDQSAGREPTSGCFGRKEQNTTSIRTAA